MLVESQAVTYKLPQEMTQLFFFFLALVRYLAIYSLSGNTTRTFRLNQIYMGNRRFVLIANRGLSCQLKLSCQPEPPGVCGVSSALFGESWLSGWNNSAIQALPLKQYSHNQCTHCGSSKLNPSFDEASKSIYCSFFLSTL